MKIREEILKALEGVNDPELHKSLVELGMVGDIEVVDGNVLVNILLTTPACPLKSTIGNDVKKAVEKVQGVKNVEVVFGEMDKSRKEAMIAKLRGREARPDPLEGVIKIAVGSGKGGVGKSTVTAAIAVELARKGYRVGLMDTDILGYSIPQVMGIQSTKPMVINGKVILPVEKNGVKVISMGSLMEKNEALIWRGPMLARAVDQFVHDVYWGELDYMLMDLPPGTGDIPLTIMQSNPDINILIVTTPQDFAANVAKRLALMANRAGCRTIGVVENMSWFVCDHCGKKHYLFGKGDNETLCRELDIPFLGSIPFVPEGKNLLYEGTPETKEAIERITDNLLESLNKK